MHSVYPALEFVGGKTWRLTRAYGHEGRRDSFVLPVGFETDLASVPKLLWSIVPPFDERFIEAAIIHDYIYRVLVPEGSISRSDGDGVFRRIMRLRGVPRYQRRLMWSAVRLSRFQGLYNPERPFEIPFALLVGLPFLVLLVPVMLPVLIFKLLFSLINFLSGK